MSIYTIRTKLGHYFKWLLLLVLVPIFVVGAISYFGGGFGGPTGPQRESSVIATVNGVEIKREEFDNLWQTTTDQARERGIRSPLQYAEIRGYIFSQLVNTKVMLALAEDMGVDVSNRKVKDETDKLVLEQLKQHREVVLGKLDKKRSALDPRKDSEYKRELSGIGSSIKMQEEAARARIPQDEIRAQIAREGISKKIKSDMKPVTQKDIEDSYSIYQVRQITLVQGQTPKEQFEAKIKKIEIEVSSGADFAALAKTNSMDPYKGATVSYNFDQRWQFPQEVQDAIAKLQPGKASSAIKTTYGTYFVKLESVKPGIPKNLDKKALQERKKQLEQNLEMIAWGELSRKMQKMQDVKISDPELEAYWLLGKAQMMQDGPAAAAKQRAKAVELLKKAVDERQNNYFASVKLAQLYKEDGKVEETSRILYPMLEGDAATIEGADLRILLGDALFEQSKKLKGAEQKETFDKALSQYQIASEVGRNDVSVHQQLSMKYKEMGRADLAAAEDAKQAEIAKRMADFQKMQEKNAPAPKTPAPKK